MTQSNNVIKLIKASRKAGIFLLCLKFYELKTYFILGNCMFARISKGSRRKLSRYFCNITRYEII